MTCSSSFYKSGTDEHIKPHAVVSAARPNDKTDGFNICNICLMLYFDFCFASIANAQKCDCALIFMRFGQKNSENAKMRKTVLEDGFLKC
ncbi:MAG: hypothetical protein DBX40_05865 [Clostridiales bacterium]|nr:MAG: hypothetical protein DBX40_05865 [Clostridiales bacterium]